MVKTQMHPLRPDALALSQGEPAAVSQALLGLAQSWARLAGSDVRLCAELQVVQFAVSHPELNDRTPEQRALLAAARDLCEFLAKTPHGRQAMLDFGVRLVGRM